MSIVLSATPFTAKAREREVEATGTDPGEFVYRLHRDTCDRLGVAHANGTVAEVEGKEALFADQILAAKACTRCKPQQAVLDEIRGEAETANLLRDYQEAGIGAEPEKPDYVEPAATGAPVLAGKAAPVLAGPAAYLSAIDGRVMGITSARYPEVAPEVSLYCAGCGEEHPAQRFAYLVKKGSGDGRPVVCRKSDIARIEANKGKPPAEKVPAARLDAQHVLPKGYGRE